MGKVNQHLIDRIKERHISDTEPPHKPSKNYFYFFLLVAVAVCIWILPNSNVFVRAYEYPGTIGTAGAQRPVLCTAYQLRYDTEELLVVTGTTQEDQGAGINGSFIRTIRYDPDGNMLTARIYLSGMFTNKQSGLVRILAHDPKNTVARACLAAGQQYFGATSEGEHTQQKVTGGFRVMSSIL